LIIGNLLHITYVSRRSNRTELTISPSEHSALPRKSYLNVHKHILSHSQNF